MLGTVLGIMLRAGREVSNDTLQSRWLAATHGETTMPSITHQVAHLGTETAFDVLARAAALQKEGRDIINLGIGQPDFPTPEHVVEAAVRALRDGHHGYTEAPGIRPLREAVSDDIAARRGVEIDPGRVIVVPGGKPTLFFAALMFGEKGVEILCPDPGFPVYENVIRLSGAVPVSFPAHGRNGSALRATAILERITPRTRLVILNSPSNPTGGTMSKKETDRLVEGLLAWPDVVVLSDEIYSRILYDGREHVSLLAYPELADRVILLDGWSKTFAMTGWRLGYGVWPDQLVEVATRLAVNCHSCVNAPAQHAGIAALTGPQDPVREMVTTFERRRTILVEGLNRIPGIECAMPGGAFYAFPSVAATGLDAAAFQERLLEEGGVATVPGTSFGLNGADHVRFSYANSEKQLGRALERLEALVLQA